jgi:hypothetical protein
MALGLMPLACSSIAACSLQLQKLLQLQLLLLLLGPLGTLLGRQLEGKLLLLLGHSLLFSLQACKISDGGVVIKLGMALCRAAMFCWAVF